jgi:hypothetical protein
MACRWRSAAVVFKGPRVIRSTNAKRLRVALAAMNPVSTTYDSAAVLMVLSIRLGATRDAIRSIRVMPTSMS